MRFDKDTYFQTEMAQSRPACERERKDKETEAAGYDIRSAVKKLEKLYE